MFHDQQSIQEFLGDVLYPYLPSARYPGFREVCLRSTLGRIVMNVVTAPRSPSINVFLGFVALFQSCLPVLVRNYMQSNGASCVF